MLNVKHFLGNTLNSEALSHEHEPNLINAQPITSAQRNENIYNSPKCSHTIHKMKRTIIGMQFFKISNQRRYYC